MEMITKILNGYNVKRISQYGKVKHVRHKRLMYLKGFLLHSCKLSSLIFLWALILGSLLSAFVINLSMAYLPVHNINTGLSYSTIQEAINANETLCGHTILVDEGIYYENVVVNKSITLVGENKERTIIDGLRLGTVVKVTAPNVTISGFTIRKSREIWQEAGVLLGINAVNCTLINNIITDNMDAVDGRGCHHARILNNIIISNSGFGIHLLDCCNCIITNNTIVRNIGGIVVSGWSESPRTSYNNTIINNTIYYHECSGIHLKHSDKNIIFNNSIAFNGLNPHSTPNNGINLEDSHNNILEDNTLTSNSPYGIHLDESDGNSINYNFISNSSSHGISFHLSRFNTIGNNTITENKGCGIHLAFSSAIIRGNQIFDNDDLGLCLLSSGGNVLRSNILSRNGYEFGIYGADLSDFINDIDNSNIANSKPIYYYVNQNSLLLNSQTLPGVGYLGLVNCTNITIKGLNISNNAQGILLAYTNNCSVKNVQVSNNECGICLCSSTNTTLTECFVISNRYGIKVEAGAFDNKLYNNTILNNDIGIYLSDAEGNIIANNTISRNIKGIQLQWQYTRSNIIVSNTISRNNYGVYISTSDGNMIYHNNFINNTIQVYTEDACNIWNAPYPSGGNYWSDYFGADKHSGLFQDEPGSDGIGDTPYVIDKDNQDAYPLMIPYGDNNAPTTRADYDGLWHRVDFYITLTAVDNLSGVAEIYYRINDGPIQNVSSHGQPLITIESANNTLEYWSIDNAGNEELPHKILTGIKLDKTSPIIGIPSRLPESEIQPQQEVRVLVNVTDFVSGVKNVTLSYNLNGSLIWIDLPMAFNTTTGFYEATILGQPSGTVVKYKIVAYDNAGNYEVEDNSGQNYVYTVIPEFPQPTILLLFIFTTLIATILLKKKRKTKS